MAEQNAVGFKNYDHGAQMASVAIKVGSMTGPDDQKAEDVRESIIACAAIMLGAIVDEGILSESDVLAKVTGLIDYSQSLAQEARASNQRGTN